MNHIMYLKVDLFNALMTIHRETICILTIIIIGKTIILKVMTLLTILKDFSPISDQSRDNIMRNSTITKD